MTVRLQKGINTIQLLTIGGNGGPRIKRMVVKASGEWICPHWLPPHSVITQSGQYMTACLLCAFVCCL